MARKRSRAPGSPAKVPASGWKYIAGRAIREFLTDHCIDLAAGLTYFAVLAIFPALLAVFSLLGVIGQEDRTVAAIEPILKDVLGSGAQTLLPVISPSPPPAASPSSPV